MTSHPIVSGQHQGATLGPTGGVSVGAALGMAVGCAEATVGPLVGEAEGTPVGAGVCCSHGLCGSEPLTRETMEDAETKSRPRLNNNRCGELFCTYAYPALYPALYLYPATRMRVERI